MERRFGRHTSTEFVSFLVYRERQSPNGGLFENKLQNIKEQDYILI